MGCGQLCIGFYCYLCTCQQCGFSLSNGTCINCTYGDGKPITCCECESPLNGVFCFFCNSRAGNSSAYDPNPNSYNDSPNFSDYTPQLQYQPILCEFCENDARYGHYCTPHVLIISNPEPCYNQNYDEFPQTLPSLFEAITGYGLGGSSMALFCRVGGGIYTNAADVGADIVGKVERNILEDDPRNPAIMSGIMLVTLLNIVIELKERKLKGYLYARNFSCVCVGLWVGLIIGFVTEYYTNNAYRTGAATNVIFGLALGYKSVIIPIFAIAVSIFVSFTFTAMYGVAVAALGMLSTIATGLAIDAYSPIGDNDGGIAEMAGSRNTSLHRIKHEIGTRNEESYKRHILCSAEDHCSAEFCFFDIKLTSLSPRTVPPDVLFGIQGIRHYLY
ncbi:vacuolar H+-pyrophosphatase [Tanacetum coccineum]